MVTLVVTLIFSSYMLFDPALWLYNLMQLTGMSLGFKGWLFALAVGTFGIAYISERHLFPELARVVGQGIRKLRGNRLKKRKQYKVLLEELQR